MTWIVVAHPDFRQEFDAFSETIQEEIIGLAELLAAAGPMLKRPHADTLNGSRHSNMKELRFEGDEGEWRLAYAFDPKRKGVLLVAGDKAGVSQKLFYRRLIAKADARFGDHLTRLNSNKEKP